MSKTRMGHFSRSWLGTLVLIVGAMAAGAILYALLFARSNAGPAAARNTETPETHREVNGGDERSGLIRIPVEAQKNSGLRVEPVGVRTIRSSLQATGTVTPDQTRIAHIRPIARGVVDEVFVQFGDSVKQGQPLLSYDNIELGMVIGEYLVSIANLRSARTDLAVKKTILDRSTEMLRVGAVALTTHDIRDAEYQSAQAQVSSTQSSAAKYEEQLHRFGLSDSDISKLNENTPDGFHRTSSHSILRAPLSGVVTAYNVSAGETVDPSTDLLTVTDISTVWVLADVYEKDLAMIRVGKDASIRVASYPNDLFEGRITYVGDLIEPNTRTVRVRCVVKNPGKRLKLDMFATVEIPTDQSVQVLAVRSDAIQKIDGRDVVFVKRSETEFELREIVSGRDTGGWTEVRKGLTDTEMVIASGSFYAKTAALRDLIGDEH